MTSPRPISPRPTQPTQPRPGTPSPTNPDGPSRPPNRPRIAHLSSALLALVMCLGFAAAAVNEPPAAQPARDRTFVIRPATPEESLRHQLEQAFLLDQIAGGQR